VTGRYRRPGLLRGISPVLILLAAGAFAAALALSIDRGSRQQVGHDFHVFWQAGRNFATGDPLYHGYLPGARQFKYPPFAAMMFQLLALVPLRVAAVLFSLLNLILWVIAGYLTWDIVRRSFPDRSASSLPLAFAVVLSAQFFLDNFHHVQMNAVIFVLVLLGLRAYLEDRDLSAAAYLVSATAIKLTPVFFVGWLVLRGRRRAALAVAPLVLACVLVPLLVRGPTTGAAELSEYYSSFLQGHQHGEVGDYTAGHNVAALVSRMTQPPAVPGKASYAFLPTAQSTAQLAYYALWSTVLLVFLIKLVRLRIQRAPVSAFELSMVFLTALLLSPITFTTHLVSLLFVFCVFLSLRLDSLSRGGHVVAAGLLGLMLVTGLSGRDLVGRTAYLTVRGYSIFAWTMLLLCVTAAFLAGRVRGRAPAR
jgi:Glycosyltransferase family 87